MNFIFRFTDVKCKILQSKSNQIENNNKEKEINETLKKSYVLVLFVLSKKTVEIYILTF